MYYPKTNRERRSSTARPLLLLTGSLTGCVVEQNYCPSSTGEDGEGSDTSTGTRTSTGSETTLNGTGSETSTSSGGTTNEGSESGSSSTGPALPVCGNGIVEGEETCDDGNRTPGDSAGLRVLRGLGRGSRLSASTDATWSSFDHNGCGSVSNNRSDLHLDLGDHYSKPIPCRRTSSADLFCAGDDWLRHRTNRCELR